MASAVKVALIAIKFHYIVSLMASPEDCKSLQDVRYEIDRIDEQIVRLLGERLQYVHAAAQFKTTEQEVAAPGRLAVMLEARRAWAEREGLDPNAIEDVYRRLVKYFIHAETERFRG